MDKYFKAFIRVVKSLNSGDSLEYFGYQNVVEEKFILAKDKQEVKEYLLKKYPQFFPDNKIFSKETKEDAQFFYVVIFELYEWEKQQVINPIAWNCAHCGQNHENTYISKPRTNEKFFGDLKFCKSDDDYCLVQYKKEYFKDIELGDDENYITNSSPNYIYKITEKLTNKCYIGKTRNEPFFRWWNHLKHSSSPFGLYLKKTKISDWTFEVLEILPREMEDTEVFRIESEFIKKYDSILNGFNHVISNKNVLNS